MTPWRKIAARSLARAHPHAAGGPRDCDRADRILRRAVDSRGPAARDEPRLPGDQPRVRDPLHRCDRRGAAGSGQGASGTWPTPMRGRCSPLACAPGRACGSESCSSSVRDFGAVRISTVSPEGGAWPPPTGGLLVERDAFQVLRACHRRRRDDQDGRREGAHAAGRRTGARRRSGAGADGGHGLRLHHARDPRRPRRKRRTRPPLPARVR